MMKSNIELTIFQESYWKCSSAILNKVCVRTITWRTNYYYEKKNHNVKDVKNSLPIHIKTPKKQYQERIQSSWPNDFLMRIPMQARTINFSHYSRKTSTSKGKWKGKPWHKRENHRKNVGRTLNLLQYIVLGHRDLGQKSS